jgi:MoxR-like ATPase
MLLQSMSTKALKPRIKAILEKLNEGIHERDEVLAVSLLSALAGHNSFLLGPPGTAKSLISKRISSAFKEHQYFECLMNKFTTPEEVVGPVSIKALKEDKYTRKTESYLPTADFAFLDEIWKSSPAILNTLLTLINEKTFKNGNKTSKVPLKALISASNETPSNDQGLEALFDRFSVRLYVPPMIEAQNFNALLQSAPTASSVDLDNELSIGNEEWQKWQQAIHDVTLSEETLSIIKIIRTELAKQSEELSIYVSDRRWQRAALLIKASAFFSDRTVTNHTDVLLLRHCLWTSNDNREAVMAIVEEAVRSIGFNSGVSLAELDLEKENLEKEIQRDLFYTYDVYKTVTLKGKKKYFKTDAVFESNYFYHRNDKSFENIFIEASLIKTTEEFYPVDESGNEIDEIQGCFNRQGSCELKYNYLYDHKSFTFTPKILFHKGDKKEEVNNRLINALTKAIKTLKNKLETALGSVENKLTSYQQALHTQFVPEQIQSIATEGIQQQIEDLKLRIQDCNRLRGLCKQDNA